MGKIVLSLLMLVATFEAFADVHCRFDPTGAPSSYLRYSPKKKMIWTLTGWPQKWRSYSNAGEVKNAPPFGKNSVTLTVFGDVPAISIKYTGNGKLWFDMQDTSYPFIALWGKIPGAPTRQAVQGVCWTDKMQPVKQQTY